ncbi:hypothetical protein [Bacillus sp. AK031]
MLLYLCFIVVTGICLIMALKKKKAFFLVIPLVSICVYGIVQLFLLPSPLVGIIDLVFSFHDLLQ